MCISYENKQVKQEKKQQQHNKSMHEQRHDE
jgi:hypothetical protein